MTSQLGERITEIRERKKLQAKDVAAELDILTTSYLKIERTGVTSLATLLKIANILNVSPAEFFQTEQKVTEPIVLAGLATKEDLKQATREIESALRTEFQKIREEFSFKINSYDPKSRGKRK